MRASLFLFAVIGGIFLITAIFLPARTDDRLCQIKGVSGGLDTSDSTVSNFFPEGFAEGLLPDTCGTERPRLSDGETRWFSRQWAAACEPPLPSALSGQLDDQFTFRFSFMPSFDTPIFMRLETHRETHRLIAKQMTGDGGYEPGIILRSKEIEISDEEVAAIRKSLANIFANRDAEVAKARSEGPKETCFGMLDGTMWIFEVVENDRYDLIQRNSPNDGPIFDLGMQLLSKSDWVDFGEP